MKLKRWNELTEAITTHPVVAAALSTGRPEILKMVKAQPLSAEEASQLYNVIRVLLETNAELQTHSLQLAQQAEQIISNFKGISRKLDDLRSSALFIESPTGRELDFPQHKFNSTLSRPTSLI